MFVFHGLVIRCCIFSRKRQSPIWFSWGGAHLKMALPTQLSIQILASGGFESAWFFVRNNTTLSDLKPRLFQELACDTSIEYVVTWNWTLVDEDVPLSEYTGDCLGFEMDSMSSAGYRTCHGFFRLHHRATICVRLMSGQEVMIEMWTYQLVGELHMLLSLRLSKCACEMRLTQDGKLLESDDCLWTLGVKHGSVLNLTLTPRRRDCIGRQWHA